MESDRDEMISVIRVTHQLAAHGMLRRLCGFAIAPQAVHICGGELDRKMYTWQYTWQTRAPYECIRATRDTLVPFPHCRCTPLLAAYRCAVLYAALCTYLVCTYMVYRSPLVLCP